MAERKRYQHLTYSDRLMIERLYSRGRCKKEIAFSVGCSLRTIYREIPRGLYTHLNADYTTCQRYAAEIAQRKYAEFLSAKGPALKLGNDYALASYIEAKIIEEKYSPYATLAQIKREGRTFKTEISVSTLYSYIDKGVFQHLTNKDLPEKGRRKRKYKKVRKQPSSPPAGTSIEKRPDCIELRDEIGHWEMDTVIGKSKGKNQALLVLTERATRREIMLPLKSRAAHETVKALDKLERKYKKDFSKIFQSITVDNGAEFSDSHGLERSRYRKQKRTSLYYCHPYSSYERGSNENANRIIRRFVPKGTSLENISPAQWKTIEHWMNNYPRRILHGNAPIDYWPSLKK